ncbi:MAG: NAD-dependent epimerase/dehydratase family protein [SAR202 cluster bacterium]|nr:NAD-dependent epimerase/dehydratase family protein [SAR202 cluster bacterium]
MKLLVTGATGFIGGAVARHLLQQGHTVRALARPAHAPEEIAGQGYEPAPGDLLDPASLERATDGVDGVFHVAALYSFWQRDPLAIYRVNVDGTQNLLEASRRSGVRRVVFTSSVGVLRAPEQGELADETFLAKPGELPDHYHRSKLLAEQTALGENGRGLEVVAVNPTAPVGPGDIKPTPTGRIILEFLGRRTPGYVGVDLNIVDVRDVAAGHLAAFERGRAGERYLLGNLNTDLADIYRRLAAVTGLRRRPVRVPYPLVLMAAYADQFVEGRILRRTPFLPLGAVRATRHRMHVDCSKAVRELGVPQSSPDRALFDAASWFVSNGYAGGVKLPAPAGEAP